MMMQSQAGEMLGAGDRVGAGWGGWGRTKEEGGYGLRRVRAGEEGEGHAVGDLSCWHRLAIKTKATTYIHCQKIFHGFTVLSLADDVNDKL